MTPAGRPSRLSSLPVSTPELSVVCKSCGSEVSPYVTECPYCGTRLRRRAPKLEREGGEIRVREGRRDRRRRRAAERAAARERRVFAAAGERPYVAIAAVLGPSILLVVQRAANLTTVDVGAITYPAFEQVWRYFTAPFVYDDIGYLFAVGLALAILVPGLERRLGSIPAALLIVACGALGMLAAVGLDNSFGDGLTIAAGGNGMALGALGAWFVLRRSEALAEGEEYDRVALVVAAAVLLLLPAIEDYASFWAGVAGGLVGLGGGYSATLGRRRA